MEYFKEAGQWIGVLTVRNVKPGQPFDQVGFRDGDILLDEGGAPHFFEKLEQARARDITLVVAPWIDPPDVRDRPRRELMLRVPPRTPGNDQKSAGPEESKQFNRHFRTEQELQGDLGYREGWEWLPHGGKWQGTLTLENLQPEGVLARAGFREKDIPLDGFSFRDRLEAARGKEPITVTVASWVEPPPLHERPRRVLTVQVPQGKN